MWKPGDLVKQRVSIFRVDEVAGKPMLVIDVIYPPGEAQGWPLEVITECNGKLYRWNPDGLVPANGPSGEWSSRTIHGGSYFD